MRPRRKYSGGPVKQGFENRGISIPIADINLLYPVSERIKKSLKYAQIVSSIREVGIIEPPIITRDGSARGKYLMLDGRLRLEALKDMGEKNIVCLISTDDEAFTYNKRVNRLATIQEHKMILNAVEHGVPEQRIARSLNIDVRTLQQKKSLLIGICGEVVELLQDKHIALSAFSVLKKMVPFRQIEAVELMIAMNTYTASYARSLLVATPQSQLVEPHKPKVIKGLTTDQMALMERESTNLERQFKMVEQSYGTDHLDLVLAKGYLGKLLGNARVVRYLGHHYQELLSEFQKIADAENIAA